MISFSPLSLHADGSHPQDRVVIKSREFRPRGGDQLVVNVFRLIPDLVTIS